MKTYFTASFLSRQIDDILSALPPWRLKTKPQRKSRQLTLTHIGPSPAEERKLKAHGKLAFSQGEFPLPVTASMKEFTLLKALSK